MFSSGLMGENQPRATRSSTAVPWRPCGVCRFMTKPAAAGIQRDSAGRHPRTPKDFRQWRILAWAPGKRRFNRGRNIFRDIPKCGCTEMPILELGKTFPLQNLLTEVSPNDSMFDSPAHYVNVGLSALKVFQYAIDQGFTRPDGLRKILDLPCGHGRVGRVLRSRFPDADLIVCDIDRDGVDFCINKLSATGVYSTKNFDVLDLGESFDLIWVGSLITHLNSDNTVKLIRCMERHLSEDGLLVMSCHGKFSVELINSGKTYYDIDASRIPNLLNQYQLLGYGYEELSARKDYGISIVSRHWLEGFFAGEACRVIAYLDHAWDNHQDVLFVKKRKVDLFRTAAV
jgi:SAM-dependent methyltransferase